MTSTQLILLAIGLVCVLLIHMHATLEYYCYPKNYWEAQTGGGITFKTYGKYHVFVFFSFKGGHLWHWYL